MAKNKLQKAIKRSSETSEQTVHRQQQNRKHMASMRGSETIACNTVPRVCTSVLSIQNTVAETLEYDETEVTAKFCRAFNKFFDCLNIRSLEECVLRSTKKATGWAVGVFNSWRSARNERGGTEKCPETLLEEPIALWLKFGPTAQLVLRFTEYIYISRKI